jgi:diguanylate cyclase (GGDEF)-like protein
VSHILSDEQFNNLVRLDFFADIGKAIAGASTLKEVLQAVMEQVATIFAPSNWSVLLRKHPSGDLVFVKVTGAAVDTLEGHVIPRGTGIAGWIAENGQALVIPDVSTDTRFDPSSDAKSGFITKSIIGVPLKTRTRVFGVLELVNRMDGSPFTSYDLKLLTTIGDFAAIALEKIYYMQNLRQVAITDPLTKLKNRRLLQPVLEREIQRQKRDMKPFSVLFVDIDDFKLINDAFGHDIGDQVLIKVAAILRDATRKSDFLCRWGGDEFIVVLPGQGKDHAEIVRKRILQDKRLKQDNEITLSIGLTEALGHDIDEVLKAVDRDMYDEKMESITANPEDMPTACEDIVEEFHT